MKRAKTAKNSRPAKNPVGRARGLSQIFWHSLEDLQIQKTGRWAALSLIHHRGVRAQCRAYGCFGPGLPCKGAPLWL